MSTPRLIYPMLDGFLLGEEISSHDGVRCYPAIQRKTEEKYILKVISVPASPVQLEALLITGAVSDKEAALSYFYKQAEQVLQQAQILHQMSHQEGFVPYLDSQIVVREDGMGYDVYLLGSYKRSVEKIFRNESLTQLGVIHMALDLCAALAACRRAGYLYVDLQPGNIFYSAEDGYRIGDLGFAALSSLKFSSLANKYHSSYTAPEMQDDFAVLNQTLDVYALGQILYQAYNGGQLAFEGLAPNQVLMAPIYADYEMADIILKACDPLPENRWQDPTQLAQALVEYMQRNEIGDDPVIPPAIVEEDEPEEFLPEADPEELKQEMDAMEDGDLVFFPAQDSPAPEDVTGEDQSNAQDLQKMLDQADELIAHTLPAPPVAPEIVAVPMPEPVVLPEEIPQPEPEVSASEDAIEEEVESVSEPEQPVEEEPIREEAQESDPEETEPRSFRFPWRILIIIAVLGLLAGGILAGVRYYENSYLQHIDQLILHNQDDSVTVQVISQVDERLLTVVCSDSYGNVMTSPVSGGMAFFENLQPQTRYTVRIEISGSHKLTGDISKSFSTPARTHVLSFTATIGETDDSVILDLTVTGPAVDSWSVNYTSQDGETGSVSFTGARVTVHGLTAGKTYTFTLSATDGRKIAGVTQTEYLVTGILLAQQPTITQCGNGILTVAWSMPEAFTVESWTLHCYNANGFEQMVTTTDLHYTFTGLTHDVPCIVEITAAGMRQSVTVTVSADPVNITEYQYTLLETMQLQITWSFTGSIPSDGWILHYSINGGQYQTVQTIDTQALIPAVPGATYNIRLEITDGRLIFGDAAQYTLPEAQLFAGFGITPDNTQWQSCACPQTEHWLASDVEQANIKDQFSPQESIGLIGHCTDTVENSEETVYLQYVILDANGSMLNVSTAVHSWNALWNNGDCTLTLPYLPEDPGVYTLLVLINGMLAHSQSITIL